MTWRVGLLCVSVPLWLVRFFALCRTALNPNISQAAGDEMLVQHLLTERLIRKIFDNPEFTKRKVVGLPDDGAAADEIDRILTQVEEAFWQSDNRWAAIGRITVEPAGNE